MSTLKNILRNVQYATIFMVLSFTYPVESKAENAKVEKKFGSWEVFLEEDGGKKICYARGWPYRTRGVYGVRSVSYMTFTYVEPGFITLSGSPGFEIDKKKGMSIHIGNHTFYMDPELVSYGWTYSSIQDKNLINALVTSDAKYLKLRSFGNKNSEIVADYYDATQLLDALKYLYSKCPTA